MSFMVALDAGSDLLWVPCDCINCAPFSATYYNNTMLVRSFIYFTVFVLVLHFLFYFPDIHFLKYSYFTVISLLIYYNRPCFNY